MAVTLLSICQSAAVEIGIERPNQIMSNADPDTRKLLRYATKVGYDLMKRYDWPALQGSYVGTSGALEGGNIAALVNADSGATFDRFVPQTMWDRSNERFVVGPISSQEYRGRMEANNSPTGAPEAFTIRGGDLYFYPAGTGGAATVLFEYIRADWINSTDTAFAADADTVKLDEELITRGLIAEYLDGEGLPWQRAAGKFAEMFEMLTKNQYPGRGGLASAVDVGATRGGRRYTGEPPVAPSRSYLS